MPRLTLTIALICALVAPPIPVLAATTAKDAKSDAVGLPHSAGAYLAARAAA